MELNLREELSRSAWSSSFELAADLLSGLPLGVKTAHSPHSCRRMPALSLYSKPLLLPKWLVQPSPIAKQQPMLNLRLRLLATPAAGCCDQVSAVNVPSTVFE